MKVLFVFLVAAIVAVSHQQSIQQTLKEWRKLVAPHLIRCMCQSKANADFTEGFFQFGELPNDPCFKCTVRCWGQGIGVITTSGNVNTTVYRSIFGITDEIVHKCGTNKNVDICQKSYEILSCSYNTIANKASANSANLVPYTPLPVIPQPKLWGGFPPHFYTQQ